MRYEAIKPYGLALLDYANGETSTNIVHERDDGFKEEIPTDIFFKSLSEFSPLEHTTLHLCYGRILDVGAGSGVHSLVLQERGYAVTAIDISPEAVEVMRRSGVKDARCVDIFDFKSEDFDTVLLLGRGIGLAENLVGLDRFLTHVKNIVKSGGQILLNSCDVTCTDIPEHLAYQESNARSGCYIGEIRMRLHYKGNMGQMFTWLYLDPKTLAEHAYQAGWFAEVIVREDHGDYLARLTLGKNRPI